MSLLRILGKLTGIENKVKWSQSKKIEAIGPDFFGQYFIYVDTDFNVAIFLPKSDRTLHVLSGDIFKADRWIKYDNKGNIIKEDNPPEEAFQWKINPKNIWFRGTGLPGKPGYKGKVISSENFDEKINSQWIHSRAKEIISGL